MRANSRRLEDGEAIAAAGGADVARRTRWIPVEAEGLDRAGRSFDCGGDGAVVAVGDQAAVVRHAAGEGLEGFDDRCEVRVAVEVVFLDVEDRGEMRARVEERAVELAGLDDEVLAVADTAAAVKLRVHRPRRRRWDRGGPAQDVGDHGGGRTLAVRAGDGDAGAEAHDVAKHFGVAADCQAATAGFSEFGIVFLDGGRIDDDVARVGDILGGLADDDRCATRREFAGFAA